MIHLDSARSDSSVDTATGAVTPMQRIISMTKHLDEGMKVR